MSVRRGFATVAGLGVALACFAGTANAAPLTCTVPTSVALDVLPAGCAAILTNGPITFTGVHASGGDIHDVEIVSLLMFEMNPATSSAKVSLQGIDHDLTAGTTALFSRFLINAFETIPDDTTYLPDTGPHTFGIAHFINGLGPGATFKLNFGEAGRPAQNGLEKVTSSADTTTSPGNFTVSSFFDVFTELTLDGGASWTVADNDFIAGTDRPGTGSTLELAPVPEPGTLSLAALGLASVAARLRRRRSHARSAS